MATTRPKVHHPSAQRNRFGLTRRDYEGAVSTLCAGCGHDSITAAIVQTFWELEIEPHRVAKLSGIGCSSKTPAYFLREAHGFNSVHGRMPSIATGANAANRELTYIGVSGDGDSLSIGLGQFCHAIRRNVNLVYILENNGVYGLTKGQFSASADVGSKAKKGAVNCMTPIDPAALAITLGATFVARSFSGDKAQLVPIMKAALSHKGFALIDVISPCVTFNDHEGSTKSYAQTRANNQEVVETDFVQLKTEIKAEQGGGHLTVVTMHDGSEVRLRPTEEGYDPTDREAAYGHMRRARAEGAVPTGLLFIDESGDDMHEFENTVDGALVNVPYEKLCPGSEALEALQHEWW
jgi:2-oxoglutarate/2-oxoacid ferredoxin oxidoreductase subunit beta